jgi:hypothetical protein
MGEMVHVTAKVYERADSYYDFTVEEYHNYVMAGVIHHNTGKSIMGMAAVHLHAARSGRKSGSSGQYRALVLCPDHLISKWREEIQITIPGSKVTTFDDSGGGCKQLLKEMVALYTELHGPAGRWHPPDGPEWYILGRDQSKLMPGVSSLGNPRAGFNGQGFEHGSSRRQVTRYRDDDGQMQREITRVYRCPRCGAKVLDREGKPIDVAATGKMMRCGGKFAIQMFEEAGTGVAAPRRFTNRDVAKAKVGAIIRSQQDPDHRYRVVECGEPLWQYVTEPKRWAPAQFLCRKMPKLFDYLIADEIHQGKSKTTAQANAFGMLASQAANVLCMTGTLIGGYAKDLFYILLRTDARPLLLEGFEWGKEIPFTRAYGRIERTETTRTSPEGSSSISRGRRSLAKTEESQSERPAPGIMPALFGRHLIGRSVFLSLEDMADNLPKLREYTGGPQQDDYDQEDDRFWHETAVRMLPEQAEAYQRVEGALVDTCNALLRQGSMKLLGQLLVATLGYPDMPWGWKAPTGVDTHKACGYWEKPKDRRPENWRGVVQPPDLDQDVVYPKEEALLEIVEREVIAGNQVWIYCQMTDKRDVRVRLQKLLTERGFEVAILRSGGKGGPKPKDRMGWIETQGKKCNVIISHPQLVETGLDFFGKDGSYNFNAIVFYETGYNIFTLRQAARRAWRLGQAKSCRVYYLYYQHTGQYRAMQLIARKMGAALALDGELSAEGLASMVDDQSAAMALARSITENMDDTDIGRNWQKLGSHKAPSIVGGPAPVYGVDILSMEAELLTRTLLDYDPDAPTVSPAQLSQLYQEMFADEDDSWLDDVEDLEDIDAVEV